MENGETLMFSNVRDRIERQFGREISEVMRLRTPTLINIYNALKKFKCTLKKPLEYNDLDNTSFYIPNKNWYVMGFTCQNYNAIIVISRRKTMFNMSLVKGVDPLKTPRLHEVHIRRYWDIFDVDEWDEKEAQEAAEKGLTFEWAIKKADWFQQHASDQYKSNPYPSRQTLKHYIKAKFEPHTWGYGDARDHGYVYSDGPYGHGSVRYLTELDCIMIDAECTLQELHEMEEE